MEIKRIVAAYFSPTGNTETIAKAIAKAAAQATDLPVELIDFTRPQAREKTYEFGKDDLLITGLPVYAGRLPNKILPFVQEHLKGDNTISVAFVCYGNRSFDDGLSELVYEQERTGFRPAGAAAFATQHAFATSLAHGRPNEADLAEAKQFALDLLEPYYHPKRMDGEPAVFLKAKPVTDTEKCIQCGTCARVCSMGSIDLADVTQTPGICIKCQACITHCPAEAKYFEHPDFLSHKEMLEANYREEKTNRYWAI